MSLGPKEQEIMDFLNAQVFDPMLKSSLATIKIKAELRGYLAQLEGKDAAAMVRIVVGWVGIPGRPGKLVQLLEGQGFSRIESIATDFRAHFSQGWLKS